MLCQTGFQCIGLWENRETIDQTPRRFPVNCPLNQSIELDGTATLRHPTYLTADGAKIILCLKVSVLNLPALFVGPPFPSK